MFHRGFDPRKPFAITPPFARCFADDDDAGGGDSSAAADDAGASGDAGAADAVDYKAKYVAEITSSKKYRTRAQEAEAARDAAEALALPPEAIEEYEELKAAAVARAEADAEAERELLEKKGKWEELRKQDAKTHEAAMAQRDKVHAEALALKDAEIERRGGIVAKLGAENPLQVALGDANVQDIRRAIFFIQNDPESEYHVVSGTDEEGRPTPQVVDREGNVVIDPNGDGKPMTVAGLATYFIATKFGARFLPPSKDTGSGSHKGGPGQENLDAIMNDPEKRYEYMNKVGGQEFLKQTNKHKSRQSAAT